MLFRSFSSEHVRGVRVGDVLMARRQRWRVSHIAPFEHCAIVTLRGTGADNAGSERAVLTPFEPLEPIRRATSVRALSAGRWRRACRAVIAAAGSTEALHTATAARIDLLPHQLSPALAIVCGTASRVLVADEVGLGKTVEAALVIAELIARGAARRVLVVTPAGLREQWTEELRARFDLSATVVDMHTTRRRQAIGAVGGNPWTSLPLVITSLDYVKRPEVLAAATRARWDLVVVDEAHHVQTGTDRHHAVAALCAQAACVVLLTATPHNGDEAAFEALCALGGHGDGLMTFRRTRADVGVPGRRRMHRLRVRATPEERRMHARLVRFASAVSRDHAGPDATLALAVLRKRAASSPFALEQTVRRRLVALAGGAGPDPQLALPFDDPTGELDAADDAPAWTVPALHDPDRERGLLLDLADAARLASAVDAKLAAIGRLLRRLREPAIVFTEYRDTLMHLRDRVAPDAAIVHGGMSWSERRAALDRFSRGSVLLTTDAAGEGLNLQRACRVVVNLELPWNPVRLEQRIGRVDRIGQTRTVHAFHLIASGGSEQPVLERLTRRMNSARRAVGAIDPCRAAAATEHARMRLARQLSAVGAIEAPDDHVLATRTTHRQTRARLGGRTLVVLRTTIADATGRVLATRLTPVVAQLADRWRSLDTLSALAAAIDEPGLDAWLAEATATHRAFWERRLAREEAVAAFLETREPPRQVGLFDRRVLRELSAHRAAQDEVRGECRRRIAAARWAVRCTVERCAPVLVLRP